MGMLKRTWKNHVEAFKDTYGVSSPVAIAVDVAVTFVGLTAWLFAHGLVKWGGLLVAAGSAIGLASRLFRAVRA